MASNLAMASNQIAMASIQINSGEPFSQYMSKTAVRVHWLRSVLLTRSPEELHDTRPQTAPMRLHFELSSRVASLLLVPMPGA